MSGVKLVKRVCIFLVCLITAILFMGVASADVFINEFLPNSVNTNYEWIELFNTGPSSLNLAYFNISEESASKNFTIGNVVIQPNEFIVLVRDESIFNQTYNLSGVTIIEYGPTVKSLNLNDGNDSVFLYNASGVLVDSVIKYANPGENISIGRYPDGSPNIYNLSTLTPGAKNDNQAPNLTWINPSTNNIYLNGFVNITVNITDDTTNISSAIINLNGANYSMNKNDGDIWTFLWDTTPFIQKNLNITIFSNDSYGQTSIDKLININLNFNDSDNDGFTDDIDYLIGNVSSINTTIALNVTINGASNLSQLFNGTFLVNITNGNTPMIEFNFIFNSSSILNLGNITINSTNTGSSAVSISGVPSLFNSTKTIYLQKVNSTAKSVCIKDADAGFDTISSLCNSQYEFLVNCTGISSNSYTCFDLGLMYKITGLSHSAVKEQCRDNDGDGYGEGCALGSDCDDNNRAKTTSCSSTSSSSNSTTTSDTSNTASLGGSNGDAASIFVCNQDWICSDWSQCAEGLQKRTCEFGKVPQHAQDTSCPLQSSSPILEQKCEINQTTEQQATCEDGIRNQYEEGIDCGGSCNPCSQENESTINQENESNTNKITGFSIKDIAKPSTYGIAAVALILAVALFFGIRIYNRRKIA